MVLWPVRKEPREFPGSFGGLHSQADLDQRTNTRV